MMHEFRKPLILLVVVLFVTVVMIAISQYGISFPGFELKQSAPALGEQIRSGDASIPVYTEEVAAKVAASQGFAALVSYTDRGFEPRIVEVQAGETVRFTNNSSSDLWIASQGGDVGIYPRTYDGCGASDLDSCEPFAPQDFWEFTFEVGGTWKIVNNLDKSKSGTIHVE